MTTATKAFPDAFTELINLLANRALQFADMADRSKDNDFRIIFSRFSNQSKAFENILRRDAPENTILDTLHEQEPSILYRVWLDLGVSLVGNNRKAALNAAVFGEELLINAYSEILKLSNNASIELKRQFRQQQAAIQENRDMVQVMRDRGAQVALNEKYTTNQLCDIAELLAKFGDAKKSYGEQIAENDTHYITVMSAQEPPVTGERVYKFIVLAK